MASSSVDKVPDVPSKHQFSKISRQRIEEGVMALAECTDPGLKYTRLAFSKEDRQAREIVIRLMKESWLEVRVDSAGNIIGERDGEQSGAPVIMAGSHIDTVREGGRFDGVAGVISAIEAVRYLQLGNLVTKHPIEVVVFTAEEPNDFGISTVGSRAMTGKLAKQQLATLKNKEGLTLGQAIEMVGGNAKTIERAARKSNDILAYLELHIEQGAVLENMGIPIGVVTGIAGFSRAQVTVIGRTDHAGATPMNIRKDALVAAAEIILSLERIAQRKYLRDTVATVGIIENFPNVVNVVPGKVIMKIEIRSAHQKFMDRAERAFREELQKIAARRAVDISFTPLPSGSPVTMDGWIMGLIEESCQECGIPYHRMMSGAGHDASHLPKITRVGMIFVPSKAGKSHCPEEWTEFEDLALGAQVLAATLLKIDERAKEVQKE